MDAPVSFSYRFLRDAKSPFWKSRRVWFVLMAPKSVWLSDLNKRTSKGLATCLWWKWDRVFWNVLLPLESTTAFIWRFYGNVIRIRSDDRLCLTHCDLMRGKETACFYSNNSHEYLTIHSQTPKKSCVQTYYRIFCICIHCEYSHKCAKICLGSLWNSFLDSVWKCAPASLIIT